MNNQSQQVINEIKKVINGKDDIIQTVWTTFLAGGHVLLEDNPGVGKTTLAMAFSCVIGLDSKRIQFTPDVVASDVIGFTMFDKGRNEFIFKEGAVMCNLLLGDEINRTSTRTQAALLEAMQEGNVTVDGITYPLPKPFHVIATQNPYGTFGTQPLPLAQLDRFMTKLSIGYPHFEDQVAMLRNRQGANPLENLQPVLTKEEVIQLQHQVEQLFIHEEILRYVTALTETTRNHAQLAQGVSPRGAIAVCKMAKAYAFVQGRDFVIPEDVMAIWLPTCEHRITISNAQPDVDEKKILKQILQSVATPDKAMLASL
ncbi:MAG: MoxR family ATPase [Solibacillus sp.]